MDKIEKALQAKPQDERPAIPLLPLCALIIASPEKKRKTREGKYFKFVRI
jgi:hypothetical protein